MEAKGDLAYKVALEVLPKFEVADFSGLQVTRETADVPDEDVDRGAGAHGRPEPDLFAQGRRRRRREGRPRHGRLRRHASTARRSRAARGPTSRSISAPTPSSPASRTNCSALKAGETKTVNVTFPANYGAANLAGKPASFEVTVKDVQAPGELVDRRRAGQGLRHGIASTS